MTASEPSSADAAPVDNESQEPGLWLWHGKAAPSPSPESTIGSKQPLPDLAPISNDSQASGFWLWHGEALAPAPPVPSPSRIERTLKLIGSAIPSAGWMAPPSALVLVGLSAWLTLHLLPDGQSIPGNTPTAALQPAPSPILAPPISPAPAGVVEAPLEQVPAASAPITQMKAEPAQHKTAQWRVPRRQHFFVRRAHGVFVHRWRPAFWESCRYQCNWSEPMVWRGGGG